MPKVFRDRVKETSTTTGTGAITLLGAVYGYRTVTSSYSISESLSYAIIGQIAGEWETGTGHLSSSTVLVRDTVSASSNANALVNFSADPKDVFVTLLGNDIATLASLSGAAFTGDISTTGNLAVTGTVGVGLAPISTIGYRELLTLTGGTVGYGSSINCTGANDITSLLGGYLSILNTSVASYTVTNLITFYAAGGTTGAGSTVTNSFGFYCASNMTQAATNYGFYSGLTAAATTWNFYASGTASNYFAGDTRFNANVYSNAGAPVALTNTATLTIANLLVGAIQGTPTSTATYTLPTGTLCDGGIAAAHLVVGLTFEWSVITLAAFAITVAAGTGHTLVGSGVSGATANSSMRFRTRRTAANTYVTYRIA
jgi:hypothetical protein